MKNAVKVFTFLVLIFILLYSFSASMSGVFGIAFEIFAFGAPVAVGYAFSRRYKREREEVAGVAEPESTLFGLSGRAALGLMPLIIPLISIVFLVAYLTSLVLGALGLSGSTVEDAPLHEMILLHALVPSLLEEMLFRYLPMKLLAPYSRRWCVILSSLYFALIHMSIFQLPYALLAGAVFIAVDLACDSVWPSVILHFLNNTVSVLWIKYGADPGFAAVLIGTLIVGSIISLIPVFIKRKDYVGSFQFSLDSGTGNTELTSPMIFIAFTLIMSILNTVSVGG